MSTTTVGQGHHTEGNHNAEAYYGQRYTLGSVVPPELVRGEGDGLGDDGTQVAVDYLETGQKTQDAGGPSVESVRWCPPRHPASSHRPPEGEGEQGPPHRDGGPVDDGLHYPMGSGPTPVDLKGSLPGVERSVIQSELVPVDCHLAD